MRERMARLVSASVRLDRRVGRYAFGVVFGTKAERTCGDHPDLRRAPGSRHAGLDAEAHQRAIAMAVIAGGAAG